MESNPCLQARVVPKLNYPSAAPNSRVLQTRAGGPSSVRSAQVGGMQGHATQKAQEAVSLSFVEHKEHPQWARPVAMQ